MFVWGSPVTMARSCGDIRFFAAIISIARHLAFADKYLAEQMARPEMTSYLA
jgi:hypothetical protein